MKVIQINCVYNTGSTGKITYDLHNELDKKGIQNLVHRIQEPPLHRFLEKLDKDTNYFFQNQIFGDHPKSED